MPPRPDGPPLTHPLLERLRALGFSDEGPLEPLGGGVTRVGELVVKRVEDAPEGFFDAEARGLARLAAAGCRVPRVWHVERDLLVQAWLGAGAAAWEDLARQLAALHATPAPTYGLDAPGFLATFPWAEGTAPRFAEVLWEGRIAPLVRATAGRLGPARVAAIRALRARVPVPEEGPTLVHGDLWAGNVVMGRHGAALIDPSAQWAERSLDLGMMTLFGGFPREFWRAYEALRPVPSAVRAFLPATRLVYVLVHVHLFGAGYLRAVDDCLDAL